MPVSLFGFMLIFIELHFVFPYFSIFENVDIFSPQVKIMLRLRLWLWLLYGYGYGYGKSMNIGLVLDIY